VPIFNYSAKDPAGKVERGVAQGASLADVAGRLSERGLSVMEIALAPDGLDEPQVKEPPPTEARSRMQTEVVGRAIGGVPLHVLHFFFRQLGVMLNAGINPADALETLSRQSTS
jgi:type II secretory pathway component PulF